MYSRTKIPSENKPGNHALHQTCQVLKNFMRKGINGWAPQGEIWKFEVPRVPENCLSKVFLLPFSKHKPDVFML